MVLVKGRGFLLSPLFPSFYSLPLLLSSFLLSFFLSLPLFFFLSISHISSPSDNYHSNITVKIFVSENIFIYKCQTYFYNSITVFPVLHVRHHHTGVDLFGKTIWTENSTWSRMLAAYSVWIFNITANIKDFPIQNLCSSFTDITTVDIQMQKFSFIPKWGFVLLVTVFYVCMSR